MELEILKDNKTFFQIRRMNVITYDIRIEQEIIAKYIALELRMPIFYDDSHEQYYINEIISMERLNKIFRTFIRKYVVCKKCNYCSTKTCMIKEKIKTTCILCGCESEYKSDDIIYNLFLSIKS